MALSLYRRPVHERRNIVSFFSWLHKRMTGLPQPQRSSMRQPAWRFHPRFEALEDRDVPSTLTFMNNLGGYSPGSLPDEIYAAQSGDTIVFDPSLDHQTMYLISASDIYPLV